MGRMDLVTALRMAAAELNSRGAVPLLDGPYEDSKSLAGFLAAAADQMEQGKMDAEPELRRIFAPTSVWDDANGSQDLGNSIHQMLRTAPAQSSPSAGAVAAQPAEKPATPQWNVDRERLKLAVEGDKDGLRVPLPFQNRAQFERFLADLEKTLLSEGITDARVVQIGRGTSGWSGNTQRYIDYTASGGTDKGWFEYAAWKPGSDTDFVILSEYALVQAMEVDAPANTESGCQLFKNGEAPTDLHPSGRPGFANAPLGAKLLALALKWNQEIYGSPNPEAGGFDFMLGFETDLEPISKPLTVYRGPDAAKA